ncbi:hypothetical protein BDA99DRAFT_602439 [Phascolomyces articulosus]|uniref:Uncharacterized protein n=1 Tax=Phascolomyces articulosus TaxID=60185 RepID=A0AAD5K6G0_9FUNG|nr:hypothetical protein BDA99DRAFT_569479 [Phascolomyces articulosus]KAI9271668.1 hypothetical protein BDA99DRAFT_602439 [Phascolomyces articulosus]
MTDAAFDYPPHKDIKTTTKQYRKENHTLRTDAVNGVKILKACRPNLEVDPILWIPMTKKERSRCIRWRIVGRLPGGKSKTCITCKRAILTKKHVITCLRLHHRLNIPRQKTDDPISSFLNNLPKSKPTSPFKIQQLQNKWPKLCQLLAELDYHQHPTSSIQQYLDPEPGKVLLQWIEPPPPPETDQHMNYYNTFFVLFPSPLYLFPVSQQGFF